MHGNLLRCFQQVFERDGYDLHVKVRLSIAEAILGSEIVIPMIDGDAMLTVGLKSKHKVLQSRSTEGNGSHNFSKALSRIS